MKIVVIGGSGRIGRRLVRALRREDCRVVAASPSSGVDAITGMGLADALGGADVVVDVSNSPAIEGALRFFQTSSHNRLTAGRAAGVRHPVVLSGGGADRLAPVAYFRAKKLQEDLVRASGTPFSIVRSTQFFEFVSDVVQEGTARDIPISPAWVQPLAADDLAQALADTVFTAALGGTSEIAGPQRLRLSDVASEIATAYEDGRRVVADVHARYFGAELGERSLLPGPDACIARSTFDEWLRANLQPDWASTEQR